MNAAPSTMQNPYSGAVVDGADPDAVRKAIREHTALVLTESDPCLAHRGRERGFAHRHSGP